MEDSIRRMSGIGGTLPGLPGFGLTGIVLPEISMPNLTVPELSLIGQI
jgi:hypothetical protein